MLKRLTTSAAVMVAVFLIVQAVTSVFTSDIVTLFVIPALAASVADYRRRSGRWTPEPFKRLEPQEKGSPHDQDV